TTAGPTMAVFTATDLKVVKVSQSQYSQAYPATVDVSVTLQKTSGDIDTSDRFRVEFLYASLNYVAKLADTSSTIYVTYARTYQVETIHLYLLVGLRTAFLSISDITFRSGSLYGGHTLETRKNATTVAQVNSLLQAAVGTTNLFTNVTVQDYDECSNDSRNDCFQHSECMNTPGSYTCSCPTGFLDQNLSRPGRVCGANLTSPSPKPTMGNTTVNLTTPSPVVNTTANIRTSKLTMANITANLTTPRLTMANTTAYLTSPSLTMANTTANLTTPSPTAVNTTANLTTLRLTMANTTANLTTPSPTAVNTTANLTTPRLTMANTTANLTTPRFTMANTTANLTTPRLTMANTTANLTTPSPTAVNTTANLTTPRLTMANTTVNLTTPNPTAVNTTANLTTLRLTMANTTADLTTPSPTAVNTTANLATLRLTMANTTANITTPSPTAVNTTANLTTLRLTMANTTANLTTPSPTAVNTTANLTTPRLTMANTTANLTTPRFTMANTTANLTTPRFTMANTTANLTTPRLTMANTTANLTTPRLTMTNTTANLTTPRPTAVNTTANLTTPRLTMANTTANLTTPSPTAVNTTANLTTLRLTVANTTANLTTPNPTAVNTTANLTTPRLTMANTTANLTTPRPTAVNTTANLTTLRLTMANTSANLTTPSPTAVNTTVNVTKPRHTAVNTMAYLTTLRLTMANTTANLTTPSFSIANTTANLTTPRPTAVNTTANITTPRLTMANTTANLTTPNTTAANTTANITTPRLTMANTTANLTTPSPTIVNITSNITTPRLTMANTTANLTTPSSTAVNTTANVTTLRLTMANTTANLTIPRLTIANTKANLTTLSPIVVNKTENATTLKFTIANTTANLTASSPTVMVVNTTANATTWTLTSDNTTANFTTSSTTVQNTAIEVTSPILPNTNTTINIATSGTTLEGKNMTTSGFYATTGTITVTTVPVAVDTTKVIPISSEAVTTQIPQTPVFSATNLKMTKVSQSQYSEAYPATVDVSVTLQKSAGNISSDDFTEETLSAVILFTNNGNLEDATVRSSTFGVTISEYDIAFLKTYAGQRTSLTLTDLKASNVAVDNNCALYTHLCLNVTSTNENVRFGTSGDTCLQLGSGEGQAGPKNCSLAIGSCTETCDTNAVCVNQGSSSQCVCKSGYSGDGTSCTDVNECESTSAACSSDENANCVNSVGSFSCVCKTGYHEDNGTCVESDRFNVEFLYTTLNYVVELANKSSTIYVTYARNYEIETIHLYLLVGLSSDFLSISNITFRNGSLYGSHTLETKKGTTTAAQVKSKLEAVVSTTKLFTNVTAQDYDECSDESRNDCFQHSECVNTPGSYTCSCPTGFIDRNLSRPGRVCGADRFFIAVGAIGGALFLFILLLCALQGSKKPTHTSTAKMSFSAKTEQHGPIPVKWRRVDRLNKATQMSGFTSGGLVWAQDAGKTLWWPARIVSTVNGASALWVRWYGSGLYSKDAETEATHPPLPRAYKTSMHDTWGAPKYGTVDEFATPASYYPVDWRGLQMQQFSPYVMAAPNLGRDRIYLPSRDRSQTMADQSDWYPYDTLASRPPRRQFAEMPFGDQERGYGSQSSRQGQPREQLDENAFEATIDFTSFKAGSGVSQTDRASESSDEVFQDNLDMDEIYFNDDFWEQFPDGPMGQSEA
ncbi:hypothetical protein Bbelb_444040, partial [Branchiostoma belcheri]